ncbi:hypothetical protein BN2475_710011 [Paraburkholderia ribeironis]|uniref:Uncharacterized protein n=1 Tax=Paraburkholderia ribeironis TaxID=1247936 RepID=A0A1N7SI13_9BURK|nr:hypothetical protein BN2475_710011 [Paraburkholderia ribeironis]
MHEKAAANGSCMKPRCLVVGGGAATDALTRATRLTLHVSHPTETLGEFFFKKNPVYPLTGRIKFP